MIKYILLLFCLPFCVLAQNNKEIKGTVTDLTDGSILVGASLKNINTNTSVITGADGKFTLSINADSVQLEISYLGYNTQRLWAKRESTINVQLEPVRGKLEAVVISTGYQYIPKERATGSFVHIDNELINRKVSTDIISRLEDITSGLVFNKDRFNASNKGAISIRGQSTIFANASPLIVVDNFPYEGDIENINPNDIETIDILKDAAAASQWGARAGNGVIIITTKKGGYNQGTKISFNSSVNISAKPDLFYQSVIPSSDYIEIEKTLFGKGFYTAGENSINKVPLTPAVELLIAKRNNPSMSAQIDAEIEALKLNDVRNDYDRYLNRKGINQQYALNIRGGSEHQKYFISAGYDKNASTAVGNSYSRISINANNTYALLKGKLELNLGIYYTNGKSINNNLSVPTMITSKGTIGSLYPYAVFANKEGNPLAINAKYRSNFITDGLNKGLLDWAYRPLEELNLANSVSNTFNYRVNASAKYKIINGLNAEALYQYGKSIGDMNNLISEQSFTVRSMINQYTSINSDGTFNRPIPLGGILNSGNNSTYSHNMRGQLNFGQNWGGKHQLNAIMGVELSEQKSFSSTGRLYGYDPAHVTSVPVNYAMAYTSYINGSSGLTIPYMNTNTDLTDRFLSYYVNGAYTLYKKYTLSASGRLDQSNLFGVNSNQKGIPLYSVGFAWDLSKEDLYKVGFLPYLKFRATYGYNGNIDKKLTAYTTATGGRTTTYTNLPYTTIINPPNPELRWERNRIINFGLDFATKNNAITGNIEYYRKKGIDLIGSAPYAPSTGISTFIGNMASTKGQGLDLVLNVRNLNNAVNWNTNFLLSYVTDKVTKYDLKSTALSYVQNETSGMVVLEGKPLYALYSYRWAGLDPLTGNPQGYLNNEVSNNVSQIINNTTPEDLVYHGSARPVVFGAFRNTVSWKNISLSVNISYRFGYYFRKNTIRYSSDNGLANGNGDYLLRWQKPGDEILTDVPSVPTTSSTNRDNLYSYAEINVNRADNIRLQDISLSYRLTKNKTLKLPVKRLQFYLYTANLAVLWKATKWSLDPDYATSIFPPVRTIAVGLKADF